MECKKCGKDIGYDADPDIEACMNGSDWVTITLTCECGRMYMYDAQLDHFYDYGDEEET